MLKYFGLVETKAKAVKVGDLFDRLNVIAVGQIPFSYKYYAICECSCGNTTRARFDSLTDGLIQSCGCLQKERSTKHGMKNNIHYERWKNMMDRCYNKKCPSYKNYGLRGISVCNRWHNIVDFINDVKDGYFYNAQIDRIDNDGNYSPENTKWSTKSQNCRNRRSSVLATINGVTKSVYDWADDASMNPKMVLERVQQYGWSIERALTEPVADKHENMLMAQAKRWEGHTKVAKRKPKTSRKIKAIEYKGETMTIKQLSVIVGVSAKLLSKRLFERGWSLERAVKNENFKGTNQFTKESTCKFQQ